jgi:hypothetical protein
MAGLISYRLPDNINNQPVAGATPLPVTIGGAGYPASTAAITPTAWSFAGVTGGIVNTTDVVLKAAGAAGVKNYLTGIQFANSAAVASEIVVKDGASTVLWRGYVPASTAATVAVSFDPPLVGTAATALNVAMITTATATRVSAQGFTGA